MTYEALLEYADAQNLIVKEKNIPGYAGRIYDNRIAIHKDIETQAEKACILAEELGHYYTNYGDVLDQSNVQNRKQEYKARLWGYNQQIGLTGIIQVFEHGCHSLSEAAEFLNVPEDYFIRAIECYKQKYGIYTVVDNYTIIFEPVLGVCKPL
ncbi:MAG: ImmA/IrrE family metallo-endopeptidase [Lacrimispora saccharolytica]